MTIETAAPRLSLQDLRKEFEQWRQTRSSRREPIPGHLWAAAATLCQTHSIAKVSKQLGLSYTDLKNRLTSNQAKAPKSVVQNQFMQLDINCFPTQWQLECQRSDGSRLWLAGNGELQDVGSMIRAFLS